MPADKCPTWERTRAYSEETKNRNMNKQMTIVWQISKKIPNRFAFQLQFNNTRFSKGRKKNPPFFKEDYSFSREIDILFATSTDLIFSWNDQPIWGAYANMQPSVHSCISKWRRPRFFFTDYNYAPTTSEHFLPSLMNDNNCRRPVSHVADARFLAGHNRFFCSSIKMETLFGQ